MAQSEFAVFSTEKRYIDEPTGIASQDGTYTLFYYSKGWRNFYTFNERGEVISTVVAPYPAQLKQEQPLGIHETEEAYHYFFQSSTHQKSLEVISLGKHSTSQSFSLLPLTTNRQDKFLQTLSLKGKLYFLLANKRKNMLIVVSPENGKKLNRYEFSVSKAVLREIKGQDYTSISGDREVSFNSLGTAKAYLPESQRLLLTMEQEPGRNTIEKGRTGILALDLQTEKASYSLVFGPEGKKRNYHTNTFLHEDRLLKVSSNKNFFQLSVYSYPALTEQKTFFYSDTSVINLIQRYLILRKGEHSIRYIEGKEVKQVLKYLNKGTLAVNARCLDGATLQLQLGSFGFLQSGGGAVMVPAGGGSFSTAGGTVHMPASYRVQQIHGSASSFSHTFETTLSAGTLEPGGSGSESLEEKERRLIESLKVRKNDRLVQLPVSFRKSFVAHYSSKEKMFTLYLLTTGDPIKTSWNGMESPDGF